MNSKSEKKKERLFFLAFTAIAIVVGAGLLLWGQYNGTLQVFDAAFFRYNMDSLLAKDQGWVLSEEEQERYDGLKAEGKSWAEDAGAVTRTFTADSVAAIGGDAPESVFSYDCYYQDSDTTVIILHGYNESAEEALAYAPYWWERGYNIIIPQLRGHSGVEMEPTTFGVWESLDLYDLIRAEGLDLPDKNLIVSGRSIGADAALLLAENTEANAGIDLIVAETVYSNLKEFELYNLKRQFKLGNFMVGIMLDSLVKRGFGFDPAQVDIAASAHLASTPALFICGGENVASGNMTRAVYEAWPVEKKLISDEEGRYLCLYADALESGEYDAAVSEILNQIGIQ